MPRRQHARCDAGEAGDRRSGRLEAVAAAHGINVRKPGSHVVFEHRDVPEAVSAPAPRPVEQGYVRRSASFRY